MEEPEPGPSGISKPPKKVSGDKRPTPASMLVFEAIATDGGRRGLSFIQIKKYVSNKYPEIDINKMQLYMKKFIKQRLKDGVLVSKTNSITSCLKIKNQMNNKKPSVKKTPTKEGPTGKGKSFKTKIDVKGEKKESKRRPKLKKAASNIIRKSMTALQSPKAKKNLNSKKTKPEKTVKMESKMSDQKDAEPVDKKKPKAEPTKEAKEKEPKAKPTKEAKEKEPKAKPTKEAKEKEPKAKPTKEAKEKKPKAKPTKEAKEKKPKAKPTKEALKKPKKNTEEK